MLKRGFFTILFLLIGMVVLHQEKTPGITLSPGLYLHREGRVVNMVIPEKEKQQLRQGKVDNSVLTARLYEVFEDSFDVIIFLYDDHEKPDSLYFGKCFPLQNKTKGIGKAIFDESRSFHSDGRLKGVIHLTRNDAIREGPILHEWMHLWGNEYLDSGTDGHWGYTSVGGQLGGFHRLVHMRDEFYKGFVNGQTGFSLESNWGNAVPFSPLELYLMGLLPSSEVPPIEMAIGAQGDPSHNGLFTAERIDTICMEDLIAIHGKRTPAWPDTQDAFRGLVVILSTAPVSDFLFDRIDQEVEQFSRTEPPPRNWRKLGNWWGKENFYTATHGLACIEMGYLEETLRNTGLQGTASR